MIITSSMVTNLRSLVCIYAGELIFRYRIWIREREREREVVVKSLTC